MKSAVWLGAVGMTLVAVSCDPGLSLDAALEGKRCRGVKPQCLAGYVCNQDQVCVLQDAGSAGAGPRSMDPPPGGAGGAGGIQAIGAGMDTMSSDVPAAADAAPSCAIPLFRDRDGDGYGSDAMEDEMFDCPQAGWVSRGGDCFDAEPSTPDNHAAQVHPGQLTFFAEGYPRPDQPGGISFDYDCSDSEEADPSNRAGEAAGDCSAASPPTVCGSLGGRVPMPRSGAGVNALCGSTAVLTCNSMAGKCVTAIVDNAELQFRCR